MQRVWRSANGRHAIVAALLSGALVFLILGPLALFSHAAGCETEWTAAVSGSWKEASNWTKGVPTSSTSACIIVSGSYTVTFTGQREAASLTLGGTGSKPTLEMLGSAKGEGGAVLTASSGITIRSTATVTLVDNDAEGSGEAQARLNAESATVVNEGTLLAAPGAAGQGSRMIDGDLTNTAGATVDAEFPLQVDPNHAGTFETRGTIHVPANGGLYVDPNGGSERTFKIAGGTIDNEGVIAQGTQPTGGHNGGGTLTVAAGTIGGNPISCFDVTADLSGSGTGAFELLALNNSLAGNIGAGYTLILHSENGGTQGAIATATSETTNEGTIELTSSTGSEARVTASSGATFTNEGKIVSEPGSEQKGERQLDGNLTNGVHGTIEVAQPLEVDGQATGMFETSGTIDVHTGQAMYVDPAGGAEHTFKITGGTIHNEGVLKQDYSPPPGNSTLTGATLDAVGGTLTGDPAVANSVKAELAGSGTGTFTLTGQSNSLSGDVGAGYTIAISGEQGGAGGGIVAAAGSFTNRGTIELTDPDLTGTKEATAHLQIPEGFTLSNEGTIASEPGAAGLGKRFLEGNVTNLATGTLAVRFPLEFGVKTSALQSKGTIHVSAGKTLSFLNVSFTMAAGVVENEGTIEVGPQVGNSFVATGGMASGNPIECIQAGVTFGESATASVVVKGQHALLAGTVGVGSTVFITAEAGERATAEAPTGLVNKGLIELTDSATSGTPSAQAEIAVSSGTLLNEGTLTAEPGAKGLGPRTVNGNVTNGTGGVIDVNQPLQIDGIRAGTFENKGLIHVQSGQTLYVDPESGTERTFKIAGGSIDNEGAIKQGYQATNNGVHAGAALVATGGTTSGNPIVVNSVRADMAGSGSGTFLLTGFSGEFTGNVGAGYVLTISGTDEPESPGGGVYTAKSSFTNSGTIGLTDPDKVVEHEETTARIGLEPGATLTNDGTIVAEPGASGFGLRRIEGDFVNNGTLKLEHALEQLRGEAFTNNGTVLIGPAETLSVHEAYDQPAGATALDGSGATLKAPHGVALSGGTLSGAGSIAGALANGGTLAPGPAPATIAVTGSYTQDPDGRLLVRVTSKGAAQLAASTKASLNGTLQVESEEGFTPVLGQTFAFLTAPSVSGQFSTTAGLESASAAYEVAYGATEAALRVTHVSARSSLSINEAATTAPELGGTTATFTVTLSSAQEAPVSVNYATANGSALAGTDYESTSGTLTFAPGQTTRTIAVTVLGGTSGQARTFTVDLSSPVGAELAVSQGTGTIQHAPPSISPGVDPSSAGNTGRGTLAVQGHNLYGSPRVELTASGTPTLTAESVATAGNGLSLTATFDLAGAPTGPRNVVVTEPDRSSQSLADAFTISTPSKPVISASIAGPTAINPGNPWYGVVQYQNLGNVDAYGTLISISGFPEGTEVHLEGERTLPLGSDLGGQRVIMFAVEHIGAGESGALGINFLATGGIHSWAYLHVHVLQTSAAPPSGTDLSGPASAAFSTESSRELAGTLTLTGSGGLDRLPFQIRRVTLPAETTPSVTSTTSAGGDRLTALLPPIPPAANFGPECSTVICGRPVSFVASARGPAEARAPSRAPEAGGPASAPRALSSSAREASAFKEWLEVAVENIPLIGKYISLGKTPGSVSQAKRAQEYLERINGCLAEGKYVSYGQLEGLNTAASGPSAIASASFATSFANTNPVTGVAVSAVEQWVNSQATNAWAFQVWTQLRSSPLAKSSELTVPPWPEPAPANELNHFVAETLKRVLEHCANPPCKKKATSSAFHGGAHAAEASCEEEGEEESEEEGEEEGGGQKGHKKHKTPEETEERGPPEPPPFPITLRAAGDPNDMIGPIGSGRAHWVNDRARPRFTYTAVFENVPTASAPAHRVVITDKLDPRMLSVGTMSLGPVRFGRHVIAPPPGLQTWSTIVDLRPAKNEYVKVEGALDASTDVITWQLTTISAVTGQPIADAEHGFLPPNTTAPEGEGAVSFSVAPRSGLRTGAKIANSAVIVFDTNAPIDTPTWVNAIDRTRPTSAVAGANATSRVVRGRLHRRIERRRLHLLTLRWRGRDRGAGLATFNVFVANGRSRFHLQLHRTTTRKLSMVCTSGKTYRFYVVARDGAGNRQLGHSRPSRAVRCL